MIMLGIGDKRLMAFSIADCLTAIISIKLGHFLNILLIVVSVFLSLVIFIQDCFMNITAHWLDTF